MASKPRHDERQAHKDATLQAHKERVADKLQGLVTTIVKLPDCLHEESGPQIAVVSKALLGREAGVHKTKEILGQLPAELSAYDQGVDELAARAADIQSCLALLSGSGGGGGGSDGSSKPAGGP